MNNYNEFAYFYTKGPYPAYSKKMAELLPSLFKHFRIKPLKILDLACGEGTFAVEMAKKGYQLTGIDKSKDILKYAKNQAKNAKVEINFLRKDMRDISFKTSFQLVTCWYDSLNYLLTSKDLEKAFTGVYASLKEKGFFIFDMNTIYGLAVNWQQRKCYIQQDTPELLEIHRPEYDYENNIAALNITCFRKKGNMWKRFDEQHRERAYPITTIKTILKDNGFSLLACLGNIKKMS